MKRLLVLPFLAVSVLFIHTLSAKSAGGGVTSETCIEIAVVLEEAVEEELISFDAAYQLLDGCWDNLTK